MTTENKYFRELALNLQREGFTIGPEENDLMPFESGMTLGGM